MNNPSEAAAALRVLQRELDFSESRVTAAKAAIAHVKAKIDADAEWKADEEDEELLDLERELDIAVAVRDAKKAAVPNLQELQAELVSSSCPFVFRPSLQYKQVGSKESVSTLISYPSTKWTHPLCLTADLDAPSRVQNLP